MSAENITQDPGSLTLRPSTEADLHAIQAIYAHAVMHGTFFQWMKERGKLGGQNKVPRLCNDRQWLDQLLLPEHA